MGYARTRGNSQAINGTQHQIEVEQEIPLWGQRRARGEAARAGVELAERGADRLESDVFVEARLTFVALLVAQAQQERLAKAVERMAALHALIAGRVETGLLGAFDLQVIALEKKRFQLARDRSAGRVQRLAGELAALVDSPSWLPEAVGELSAPELTDSPAARQAPEVALARARDHVARVNADLVGRERLPALRLKAGAYLTTAGDSSSVLGGVAMPIPSFDTGNAMEERAGRERAAASASLDAVEAENGILRTIAERERGSLRAAYSAFNEGTSEQLQTIHVMAEQSYRAGQVDVNFLVDTLRMALEVELESLDALQEVFVADVRARALSGRLLEP